MYSPLGPHQKSNRLTVASSDEALGCLVAKVHFRSPVCGSKALILGLPLEAEKSLSLLCSFWNWAN
jgi:hypothetical protein